MSVRRATTADLDAIMRLERASFPTDAWSTAMMREELAGPHGYYLVLDEPERGAGEGDGDVVGARVDATERAAGEGDGGSSAPTARVHGIAGYGGLRAVRGARDADIQTIALAEHARGRGQGRALLRALLTEASRRGVDAVFLEVRADNPVAERLYLSEGFAETGRRARYYQPDNVDAIVMQLDLRAWAAAVHEVAAQEIAAQEGVHP